jgi:hypothetical protein
MKALNALYATCWRCVFGGLAYFLIFVAAFFLKLFSPKEKFNFILSKFLIVNYANDSRNFNIIWAISFYCMLLYNVLHN